MARKYVVADVGHSFVRRTVASLFFPRATRYRRPLHYPAAVTSPGAAVQLADRHNLLDRVSHMYTLSTVPEGTGTRSLVTIEDIVRIIDKIRDLDPDFVLVHIASNEIANMRGDLTDLQWKRQIRDLVVQCRDLVDRLPGNITVCFMEVVPRIKTRGKHLRAEFFNRYSKYFNHLMARLHTRSMNGDRNVHPGFRYAKARGWRYMDVPGRGNAVEKALDSMLAYDGIYDGVHPSLNTLRSHYSRCVERAIKHHHNIPARLARY